MWKKYNSQKSGLLKLAQENLEQSQKNTEVLTEVLCKYLESFSAEEKETEKTIEEKQRAAYALNLCTVSVSQIIDYNDERFLEREYDAILNNLNLEQMPKDEALLSIMKQLLDVITFFRLQEGDRKMMDKEYEHKMKNAIWSAVPNPSMIVASDAISMGISLAVQVGIGYMNYRKEKARIILEKESTEWQLQRSAMEQFNALRRELFETAWRLADEYNFPDKYRITERQITQFNNILLDADPLRRYERLCYIKDNFEAYPPFKYYIGNAANEAFHDSRYAGIKDELKKKAIIELYDFLNFAENKKLLREDQLVASGALELFELVDDIDEKEKLLERAIEASGSALDVCQICAVSYYKINRIDKACKLLKMLVNERYCITLNAQLLSRLYVFRMIEAKDEAERKEYEKDYWLLSSRYSQGKRLFPMPNILPKTDKEKHNLMQEFIENQKNCLGQAYAHGLYEFILDCENRYNLICKSKGNITSDMMELLKRICDSLKEILDETEHIKFVNILGNSIYGGSFAAMMNEYETQKRMVTFDRVFKEAFMQVAEAIGHKVNTFASMEDISTAESALYSFMKNNNIKEEDYSYETVEYGNTKKTIEDIFKEAYKYNQQIEDFLEVIRKGDYSNHSLIKKPGKVEFIVKGEPKFKSYIERNRNTIGRWREDKVVAILNDMRIMSDTDLIFTVDEILVTGWLLTKATCRYNVVSFDKTERLEFGTFKYSDPDVNLEKLYSMISALADLSRNSKQRDDETVAYMVHNRICAVREESLPMLTTDTTNASSGTEICDQVDLFNKLFLDELYLQVKENNKDK